MLEIRVARGLNRVVVDNFQGVGDLGEIRFRCGPASPAASTTASDYLRNRTRNDGDLHVYLGLPAIAVGDGDRYNVCLLGREI